MASKKRKSRALLSNWTAGQAGPEAAQQLTADPAHKKKSKKKKKSEAAAAPAVAPDPALAPKKKKQTVKVVGAYAVQPPAGESAAQAEEDWCQDPGVVEEGSMQWGGKQKRKRTRVAASTPPLSLPPDQAAEKASPVRNLFATAVYNASVTQQRQHSQAAQALVKFTVPPLRQSSQAQAVVIDQDLRQITGRDNLTHYSPAERQTIVSVLKEMEPGTVVCLHTPQVKQSLLTSFYGGCSSQPACVGLDNPAAAAAATAEAGSRAPAAAATAEAGGGPPAASESTTTTTSQSSGHHADAAVKGDAKHSSGFGMLADDAEGLARRAPPLIESVLWTSSRQGSPSSSDASSTALNTVQNRPIPPEIMAKFAAAAAAVATARAASAGVVATAATAAADAHDSDTLAAHPTAGLPASNADNCRGDKLSNHKGLLQKASTCDEGLAGSGLGAGFAEDADETVVEEESQQVGVTEGVPMLDVYLVAMQACVCCASKNMLKQHWLSTPYATNVQGAKL